LDGTPAETFSLAHFKNRSAAGCKSGFGPGNTHDQGASAGENRISFKRVLPCKPGIRERSSPRFRFNRRDQAADAVVFLHDARFALIAANMAARFS